MNANVNYIGMVNLLCALRDASIISEAEARKIAARLRWKQERTSYIRLNSCCI